LTLDAGFFSIFRLQRPRPAPISFHPKKPRCLCGFFRWPQLDPVQIFIAIAVVPHLLLACLQLPA
jgi:hypothetical protein